MKKYIKSHFLGIACTILILALSWGVAGIKDEPSKQPLSSEPLTMEQFGKQIDGYRSENERLVGDLDQLIEQLKDLQ